MTASHASAFASEVPLSERGPAPRDVVVGFGFWLYLLSDVILFAAIFAAYAVLASHVAGGPSGAQAFDRPNVLIETVCLLTSSFTCGIAMLELRRNALMATYFWLAVTFLLGAVFIALEISEFAGLVARGAGPGRSAFLSAFFTLVGTHGLHVIVGLLWILLMVAQMAMLGLRPAVVRRLLCFSLFWHTLDIVWVGVLTIVYLGAR